MSLFVIADTHLSESAEKPMDIFGYRWSDWTKKLCQNWQESVSENDTVVIAGDISWAMTLEEAKADFKLLDSLPGKKVIGKGNHDFWWNTVRKNEIFFAENGIDTIKILYNNAYESDGVLLCGCRGWYSDEKNAPDNADYEKIVAREVGRLERSLKHANEIDKEKKKIVFFHFPPVFADFVCRELVDVLHKYGVSECYYGHIHGKYDIEPVKIFEGISFRIISGDYLGFKPHRII